MPPYEDDDDEDDNGNYNYGTQSCARFNKKKSKNRELLVLSAEDVTDLLRLRYSFLVTKALFLGFL